MGPRRPTWPISHSQKLAAAAGTLHSTCSWLPHTPHSIAACGAVAAHARACCRSLAPVSRAGFSVSKAPSELNRCQSQAFSASASSFLPSPLSTTPQPLPAELPFPLCHRQNLPRRPPALPQHARRKRPLPARLEAGCWQRHVASRAQRTRHLARGRLAACPPLSRTCSQR
eukprot:365634-Chlamydomonas_euryale.AAC.12